MEPKNVDVLLTQVQVEQLTTEPEAINIPTPEVASKSEPKSDINVDDYGIEVPKQEKVYTQSEVQEMIRDRLNRVKQPDMQPSQQPQQSQQTQQQDFQYDDQDSDTWEVQLERFIDNTISKREQRTQTENWQKQEQETQANFEVRFNQGAAKYPDFEQVLVGKPLTPQMVLATRGMQDPAAFLYAAAKTQPKELENIAKISDPYAQAIELGRLEERMRRSKPIGSQAPKPIDPIRGDVSEPKQQRRRSVDDILRADEKVRKQERMRGRVI